MSRLRALLAPHQGKHTRAALRRSQTPSEPFGPALRIGVPPGVTTDLTALPSYGETA